MVAVPAKSTVVGVGKGRRMCRSQILGFSVGVVRGDFVADGTSSDYRARQSGPQIFLGASGLLEGAQVDARKQHEKPSKAIAPIATSGPHRMRNSPQDGAGLRFDC